jgi:hypothetical protein
MICNNVLDQPEDHPFDKAFVISSITDIFLDAIEDDVDSIDDKEIMHFLGVSNRQLLDLKTNTSYDLRCLRRKIKRYHKTKQSFVIYDIIDNLIKMPTDK